MFNLIKEEAGISGHCHGSCLPVDMIELHHCIAQEYVSPNQCYVL